MKLRAGTAVVGAFAIVLASMGTAPAAASDEASKIYDALDVVGSIAPEFLDEGVPIDSSALEVHPERNDGVSLTVEAPQKIQDESTQATGGEMQVSPQLSIVPEYVTEQVGEQSQLFIWETKDPSVAAYIQPTITGTRIFTAISDRNAPVSYDYRLDVPEGSTLRENSLGYQLLGGRLQW